MFENMRMKEIVLSGIVMLLLDSIYLSTVGGFFRNMISKIQSSPFQFKMLGAVLCYFLLILGINYFILGPRKSLLDAFLLGFLIYGVYETTNYAIITKWNMTAVVIDSLWGGILFTLTTYFTRFLM